MAYKYESMINQMMDKIGGVENISYATHCATRFRLTLKDMSKVDKAGLEKIKGVLGLRVMDNNQLQIICGTVVSTIYDEFQKITGFKGDGSVTDTRAAREDGVKQGFSWKKAGHAITEYLSGTVAPVIPIYLTCGLLLAILSIATQFFGLSEKSGTYIVLNACSLGGLYFMPIALGWSACAKLGADPALGAMLGMTVLYSTINNVSGLSFLGIPVQQVQYNGSFLPIILGAPFLALIYKFFRDKIPQSIRYFMLPLITMLITVPVELIVIGPLGYELGTLLSVFFTWLGEHVKLLAITIWSFVTPLGIITGFDKAIYALNMEHLNTVGFDNLFLPGGLAGNSAIGGAALAVAFLSRDKDVKSTGASSGVTALIGITEPALYGVCLRFRTPLIGSMVGAAIGGFFAGLVNLVQYVYAGPGLSTCFTYLSAKPGGVFNFIMCFVTIGISAASGFAVTLALSRKEKKVYGEVPAESEAGGENVEGFITVSAPAKGEVVPMKDIPDEVFASGALGTCVGITPSEGKVYAPVNGTVVQLSDTLHAIGIESSDGAEILIHVGIDTVEMKGDGFTAKVEPGQTVSRGQALLKMDLDKIKAAGHPSTVITIVTNSDEYISCDPVAKGRVNPGQDLMKIKKMS